MKSPFKFLDPYELKDQNAFFGRAEETKDLYNLVTKNRLTFVYGPSGTGKTSLVQCGLAARFGGVDWLPISVRRNENINASLYREVGKVLQEGPSFRGNIAEAIGTLFNRYLRPVYLIFDQFEELFILGKDEPESEERQPFYDTIAAILDAELPCRLLFILREDYFGYLNQFEKTVPELYHRKLRVEPMNRDNLRTVVTGSCHVNDIAFGDERRDPDDILDNMLAGRAGKDMPYVQIYLHMLYQEAVRQQLPTVFAKGDSATPTEPLLGLRFDQSVIKAVGRIDDVLSRFLKEQEQLIHQAFQEAKMPKVPEDTVRRVLDAFVNKEGTKVPVPYHTAPDGTPVLEGRAGGRLALLEPNLVSACLGALERSRILRRSEDNFEIAHDTLAAIVAAQRSVDLRREQDVYDIIEIGYRDYIDSSGVEFFDEKKLARIEPYLDQIALKPEWKVFLEKSRAEVERHKQAELREKEAKLRRLWLVIAVIGLVALVAITALLYALQQKSEADKQKVAAETATQKAVEQAKIVQDAKAEAEQNLEKARSEEAKTKEALLQIQKEKKATEAQRQVAENNYRLAQQKTKEAEQSRANLENSNIALVDGLLTDAGRWIATLHYPEALENLKAAAGLGQKEGEVALAMMEIAFFHAETGDYAQAKELTGKVAMLLKKENIRAAVERIDTTDGTKARNALRSSMQALDAGRMKTLEDRYFGEMVVVKAGTFGLGQGTEKRTVQINNDFEIARTETTMFQFMLFCTATKQDIDRFHYATESDKVLYGTDPVVMVSWFQACEYANWLSQKKGLDPVYNVDQSGKHVEWAGSPFQKGFRLPTEIEWEYAAHAGPKSETFEYAGSDNLDVVAVWSTGTPSTVANKKPNGLGLYDMSGNVWEWCWDWFGPYPNPIPSDYRGPNMGDRRVNRGGGRNGAGEYCKVSHRNENMPGVQNEIGGFRLVRFL